MKNFKVLLKICRMPITELHFLNAAAIFSCEWLQWIFCLKHRPYQLVWDLIPLSLREWSWWTLLIHLRLRALWLLFSLWRISGFKINKRAVFVFWNIQFLITMVSFEAYGSLLKTFPSTSGEPFRQLDSCVIRLEQSSAFFSYPPPHPPTPVRFLVVLGNRGCGVKHVTIVR